MLRIMTMLRIVATAALLTASDSSQLCSLPSPAASNHSPTAYFCDPDRVLSPASAAIVTRFLRNGKNRTTNCDGQATPFTLALAITNRSVEHPFLGSENHVRQLLCRAMASHIMDEWWPHDVQAHCFIGVLIVVDATGEVACTNSTPAATRAITQQQEDSTSDVVTTALVSHGDLADAILHALRQTADELHAFELHAFEPPNPGRNPNNDLLGLGGGGLLLTLASLFCRSGNGNRRTLCREGGATDYREILHA